MEQPPAALQTIAGRPVLRFERRLSHPPAKVWTAITDPAEMAHWFPGTVEAELKPGAAMRFSFEDEDSYGEILELDPPRVFAYSWGEDVLRFELIPDGSGCRLVFTQTLGGGWVGGLAAGRNAVGWDVCLDALDARLHGTTFEEPTDQLARIEFYVAKFGLAEGEVDKDGGDYVVRFARDLMWTPVEEVWAALTEQQVAEEGSTPPPGFTNGYVPAGPVTAVEAPNVLEYEWQHSGERGGRVRWEFAHDPEQGTRVVLTQTVPARLAMVRATALAAWQTQLELLFARTLGATRSWPEGRTEELTQAYRERLDAAASR